MDLDSAIAKHAEWKVKFRTAITKKENMDAEMIGKDNCCELGKWLHGPAQNDYGRLTSLSTCIARHAAFHVEAGKVARTINSQKFSQAEAMIGTGTPYTQASNEVGLAIIGLKKEAGL